MMSGALSGPDGLLRCPWALSAPEYLAYHDDEWGRPVSTVQGLYERMTLEAFQSGLSWLTILRKRENFREPLPASGPSGLPHFPTTTSSGCWAIRESFATGRRSRRPLRTLGWLSTLARDLPRSSSAIA